MATSKVSIEKRKYETEKETYDRKNEQFHMLLSTTYGLNNSHTKRIHVGLQTVESDFEPIVKLTGSYAEGINFNVDSWQQFQQHLELMEEYLSEETRVKPNPILVNNITINFTSAYGSRAILLAYKENETSAEDKPTPSKDEEADPPAKKRKAYSVAIVMKKITFLGLKTIAKCVDAHLTHLQCLSSNVNKCAQYLIKEIELLLPNRYMDRDIVKLTLKGNYHDIERNVRTQINDLTFLDTYFNIIFVELISLRFSEILRIILSTHAL